MICTHYVYNCLFVSKNPSHPHNKYITAKIIRTAIRRGEKDRFLTSSNDRCNFVIRMSWLLVTTKYLPSRRVQSFSVLFPRGGRMICASNTGKQEMEYPSKISLKRLSSDNRDQCRHAFETSQCWRRLLQRRMPLCTTSWSKHRSPWERRFYNFWSPSYSEGTIQNRPHATNLGLVKCGRYDMPFGEIGEFGRFNANGRLHVETKDDPFVGVGPGSADRS